MCKFQATGYEDELYKSEADLLRERYHGACLWVRSLVTAESSKLRYTKICRCFVNEVDFLRAKNRQGLEYIERLLSDGRTLRCSLNQRERILNCCECIIRGYLSYITNQQKAWSISTEASTPEYKPVTLDVYKTLTSPDIGDLDKSWLVCNLIAKINEVSSNLTIAS